MEKLTYKDFKIGQKVTCVKLTTIDNKSDFYEQHLTIGKSYKIEDTDFHFPDSVVVRSDNDRISMFFRIELFTGLKMIRKLKLEKIKKSVKNRTI